MSGDEQRGSFLFQDWHRYSRGRRTWRAVLVKLTFDAGFLAVFLFRLGQVLHRRQWRFLSRVVRRINLAVSAAELNPTATVGPGLFLPHPYGVGIGGSGSVGCRIGKDVTLHQGVSLGAKTVEISESGRRTDYPTIGDGAILYPHVLVFGPVRVGEQCVVLGNAVVTEDLEGGRTYGGIPARPLRTKTDVSAADLRGSVAEQ